MGYINSLPNGDSSEGLEGPPGPQEPEGAQGPRGPKRDPGTGFKLASDGNFDMDGKKLLNLRLLPDAPMVGDYGDYVKDLRSGVNKGYLNEKFLKKDAGGNYFDLKGSKIRNGEPYYDGLFGDRDLVSKEYVDRQDNKQNIAIMCYVLCLKSVTTYVWLYNLIN